MGLTLPLYLALFLDLRFPPWLRRPTSTEWRAGAPGARRRSPMPAALVAAYNVARFGSPFEFGYGLIPGVLDEPWYAQGILAVDYIPRHLHLMLHARLRLRRQLPVVPAQLERRVAGPDHADPAVAGEGALVARR